MVTKTAQRPSSSSKPGQQVARTTTAQLPAALAKKMQTDVGKGVSTAAEDRIIPLIYILQANSPQVKPRDPKYIKDAQAGDIWLRNSAKQPIVKGDDGFEFIPAYFKKVWIEWQPNRGGLVAVHEDRPEDATLEDIKKDDGSDAKAWIRENENHVVETRQHFGFANGQPYCIPFSSSGHTVSRTWMDLMNQFMIPGTKDLAPSFARKYHFTTIDKTNAKNQSWSIFKIEDRGWCSEEEYDAGSKLHDSLARGEKQAEAPDADQNETGGTRGDGRKL